MIVISPLTKTLLVMMIDDDCDGVMLFKNVEN